MTRGSTSPHVSQAQLAPATTRPLAPLGLQDAHAIAGAQTIRPQAGLSFPSPAPRRVRTPTSSCPASPHEPSTPIVVPTPHTLPAPRYSFVPLPRLLCGLLFPLLPVTILPDMLHAILAAAQPRMHTTEFVFEWTMAAATHNLAVLRRYGGNLSTALAAQPFLSLSPGSEFRAAQLLAPLPSRHPLWAAFAERITDGAEFTLVDITDAECLTNVTATLARGNHKSARGHKARLLELLKDEVKRGWQLQQHHQSRRSRRDEIQTDP